MAAALAAGALSCQSAHAQIRTDASLGRAAQSIQGPNYILPQSLGMLSGSNLFHSFSVFNIDTGQSATFTTTTLGIANVISRVTGGSPSLINGLLSLHAASGAPNFFFINPAGVVFGSGASIDVPGAFHVGTADYIAFADGKFFADLRSTSTFSSAPPEAFGFLGTGRAPIAVSAGAMLSTRPLQPLSLVGGDIEIDGGQVSTVGGDIRVVALGQRAQEVSLSGPLPAADGNLQNLNGGRISSSSVDRNDGGSVKLSAGVIIVDGQGVATGVFSDAVTGTGNGGDVEVRATNDLRVLNGGALASSTSSAGNGGALRVNAGSILIDNTQTNPVTGHLGTGTGIFSYSVSSARNAGSVEIAASGNISIFSGGQISSRTFADGNAGLVKVNAGSIDIDAHNSGLPTGILSEAVSGSAGAAGRVEVAVAGNL